MTKAPEKGKGSVLKGKWHGVPKPVLLVGAGVGVYLLYRWYQNRNSSSSTAAGTTPSTSTGNGTSLGGLGGGYSGGGYGGGYGGAGGGSGTSTPPATTQVPGQSVPGVVGTPGTSPLKTAIGRPPFKVKGKTFNSVSSFIYGGNTYYGIKNPTEAKQLEQLGVDLVHSPTDPTGKGLFVMLPHGRTVIPTRTVHHQVGKQSTGTKHPFHGYTGAGTTQVKGAPPKQSPPPEHLTKAQIRAHTGGKP